MLPGIIRCKQCIGRALRCNMKMIWKRFIEYKELCWFVLEIEREIVFCYLRCWQEKFVVRWFYWSTQTIRVVLQIYREQNNRRDVSQSENTDDTITAKGDWTILILSSLIGLFVVVIWNGKGKYLWMKLLLAFSLNWNFFKKRNKKKERKRHSDYRCWHSQIH